MAERSLPDLALDEDAVCPAYSLGRCDRTHPEGRAGDREHAREGGVTHETRRLVEWLRAGLARATGRRYRINLAEFEVVSEWSHGVGSDHPDGSFDTPAGAPQRSQSASTSPP